MFPGFVFCVVCRDKLTIEHFLFFLSVFFGLERNVLVQWVFVALDSSLLKLKPRNVIDFIQ